MRVLRPGDMMIVTRLDRARAIDLNILAQLSAKNMEFRSLDEVWTGTTTPYGRLMVTILGGVAEFERELVRTRTAEGRAPAMSLGMRMGRKPKLNETQRVDAKQRLGRKERMGVTARSECQ